VTGSTARRDAAGALVATKDQPAVSFSSVLRNRQFLCLWLAQLVSSFGDWLAIVALFSLVAFRWNGTPYQVSSLILAFLIPVAVLGPVAGVYVDRWNLKRTMIASDLLRAGIVILIALATNLSQLYFLIAMLSCISIFFLPAQSSMIPLLVSKEELLVANALNTQAMHLTKIVGPGAAGLLVAWAGERACFVMDAASFVFSAALLARISASRPPGEAGRGVGAVLRDLREGLRFLHNHAVLRFIVVAMAAALFAIGAFDALVAVYVRDLLGGGPRTFGWMIALIGVGTISGAAMIGKFGQRRSKVELVLLGILGIGAGIFLMAVITQTAAALACCVLLGVLASAAIVPSQAILQEATPRELLGRVNSTALSVMTTSQFLAIAAAGKVADWIGIRPLYHLVAGLLVGIAAFGWAYLRANRIASPAPASSEPAE
jgi:MFS family permease